MSDKPILVYLSNGSPMVWNPDDWFRLRKDHRIIGNLMGTLAHLPKQNVFNGMPTVLLPEEVTLLVEKGVAKLVELKDPTGPPTESVKKKYSEYLERVNREQVECYEEERKRQVLSMIDIIVEGKKRKLMKQSKQGTTKDGTTAEDIEVDRDAIFKAEMQKASATHASLVQTFTEDPWYEENDFKAAEWDFPSTKEEKLKYAVFKDLWEKKYYLTSGKKFGGDYLVYPGEPVKFHSFAIVECRGHDDPISMIDFVVHGRIGSSTRKTYVLASMKEDGGIVYQSDQLGDLS